MSMNNFLGVITARSGSKSISHKNLQAIKGRNLLEWTSAAFEKSEKLEKAVVSTDSELYANFTRFFGVQVPFVRPAELATDESTDSEVFRHLCGWLTNQESLPQFMVHLRPTTPFRDPGIIDEAIKLFLDVHKNYSALRSVHKMSESAYKCFEVAEGNRLVRVFSREQSLDASNNPKDSFPSTFFPNGYIDIIKTEYFLDTGNFHGDAVYAFQTETALEIDSEHDLEIARIMAENNSKLYDKLFV